MTDVTLPDARHWPSLSIRDKAMDAHVPRNRESAHRLTLQIRQTLKGAPYSLADKAEHKILALFRNDS